MMLSCSIIWLGEFYQSEFRMILCSFCFNSEDSDCGLLTVGSWYAMTGYGFALVKNSKYLDKFNKKMIEYRENGKIEE